MVMIGGAIQNGFFFWAWYAWQPYFLELLERDAVWVAGVVAALLSVAMIAGNSLVKFFTRFCGRRSTMLVWTSVAFSFGTIGVGVASNFVFSLGFLLIAAIAMGVQMPVRQAFIHNMVTSEERATVVSFDSMITGIGAVGGQAGLGIYSDRQGYSVAYIVGGAITLLALPFVWAARRTNTDADYFEGTKGVGPSCVPHGLPALSSVDSTPHT